jgi:hypothetical protein
MPTVRKHNHNHNHTRRAVSSFKSSKIRGGRKWSLKYKKSINCRRPRGFSQRQHCKYGRGVGAGGKRIPIQHKSSQKQPRFNQSGGDVLNNFPSDISMSLRSIGHSFMSGLAGLKGFQPSPSPLPYNDHKLQKTEVAVSDRVPDIKSYYQNAMNLIPSL